MEHLPPVDSDDTATNSEVDARVDRIMAAIREDLRQQTRTFIAVIWMSVLTAALIAGAFGFAAAKHP